MRRRHKNLTRRAAVAALFFGPLLEVAWWLYTRRPCWHYMNAGGGEVL